MKRIGTLLDVATAGLTVVAVSFAAMVIWNQFATDETAPGVSTQNLDAALERSGSLIGSPAAQLRIVEFADYQCPFCATVQVTVDSLVSRSRGRVALVFRHFPLAEIHPHATAAALAAECAGAQPVFPAFHHILFASQKAIGSTSWLEFARQSGVADMTRFESCLSNRAYQARIDSDVTAGTRKRVKGTPSFFIGRHRINGMTSYEVLDSVVKLELAAVGNKSIR